MALSPDSDARPPLPNKVDFYFDPMCPWAYQTSLWIRAVASLTGLEVIWKFFSLEEINRVEGKKHPWEREWSYGWGQMRVAALLRRDGNDLVDRWYAAVGRAFHELGVKTHDQAIHREILTEAGLPADALDRAIADPTTSDDVKADHDAVVATHGAFGVPTLVFDDGNHIYGPVTVPAPQGDEALALWELTVAAARVPTLYELKRPKTQKDLAAIGRAFTPYIDARDWNTVENPAP